MNKTLKQLVDQSKTNQFWIADDFKQAFDALGMTSVENVFSFEQGHELVKPNIASFRSRTAVDTQHPQSTFFLKRYNRAPVSVQLKNWISGKKRRSNSMIELEPIVRLATQGIGVPRPIAHGQTWHGLFEVRSFLATEKIPDAESLEKKLPPCFESQNTIGLKERRAFLQTLAHFVRRFHDLGYRHRDLYLAHIFRNTQGDLFLIDLARAFQPVLLKKRFQIKDLAQLNFSLPGYAFSNSDRLRLYLAYVQQDRLTAYDKTFIRKILIKVTRMTSHDLKRKKSIPYLTR